MYDTVQHYQENTLQNPALKETYMPRRVIDRPYETRHDKYASQETVPKKRYENSIQKSVRNREDDDIHSWDVPVSRPKRNRVDRILHNDPKDEQHNIQNVPTDVNPNYIHTQTSQDPSTTDTREDYPTMASNGEALVPEAELPFLDEVFSGRKIT